MKPLLAEALGTFGLVFLGTGAIIVEGTTSGLVTPVGIALVFGLAVFTMVSAFGDVSGAHLNPAVTIAFASARRFPIRKVPGYVAAQSTGALAASLLLRACFPLDRTLGSTAPRGGLVPSLILEIVMTFLLMLVVLSVSTGAKEKGVTAALAIGAVITVAALVAGPVSGASLNPARSLAPAVVSGNLSSLWVYLVAPVAGALLAIPVCRGVRGPECCSA